MWSDLTTGVQIADLVSYPVSWGVRFQGTDLPAREELEDELLAAKIKEKRHCGANATKPPSTSYHGFVSVSLDE